MISYIKAVRTGLSAKIAAVSFRWRLMVLCRALLFAECLALDKDVFAECFPVPRVLLSLKVVVTAREQDFAECPIKNTQQIAEHSAKSWIPVVIPALMCTSFRRLGLRYKCCPCVYIFR
jgi:hypothetical protein